MFEDRLTTNEDHAWFIGSVQKTVEKDFGMKWKDIMTGDRLLYCDFMDPNADPRLYGEITDVDKLKLVVNDYLEEHNGESKSPMPLVMFLDAIEHVLRIARILRQPQGNALLLGVGGSGRQSMSKMATFGPARFFFEPRTPRPRPRGSFPICATDPPYTVAPRAAPNRGAGPPRPVRRRPTRDARP